MRGGSKWWWKIIFKDFMRQCTFRSWHPKKNSFRSDGLKTRFTYYPLSHEFITIYNRLHSKTFRLVLICSSLGFFPFLSPRFSSRTTFTVQCTWRSRSCPTPFPYRRYGFRDGYPYFCKRIVSTSMIYALGRVTDRWYFDYFQRTCKRKNRVIIIRWLPLLTIVILNTTN